jgi:hypothetical protein
VLESGIKYQLAMWPIQQYSRDLFSVRYVIQNLYNYFLNPPRLRYAFPYIWPQTGLRDPVLWSSTLPQIYFTEENIGLIFDAPFLLFAFAGLGFRRPRTMQRPLEDPRYRWLGLRWWLLPLRIRDLPLFFWASNRYCLTSSPAASSVSWVSAR